MKTSVNHAMERLAQARPVAADDDDVLSPSEEEALLAWVLSDDAVAISMSPRARRPRRAAVVVVCSVAAVAVALVAYVAVPGPATRGGTGAVANVGALESRGLLSAGLAAERCGADGRSADMSDIERVLHRRRGRGVGSDRPRPGSGDSPFCLDRPRCDMGRCKSPRGVELHQRSGMSRRQCERLYGWGITGH